MADSTDYYALLGITRSATPEEITNAFRQHVSRFPQEARDPVGNAAFRILVTAYKVLSDPVSRERFDQSLATRLMGGAQRLHLQLLASHTLLPALEEPQLLYLLLDITSSPTLGMEGAPLNLCLVIDRSTSMEGARISQVKAAACTLIEQMKPTDSISVVSFSDFADVIVPCSLLDHPKVAQARVSQLSAGGGTEILQGLQAGFDELEKGRLAAGISHLILLTDGHTYGDERPAIELAQRAAASGMGVTAFGIGDQWNDAFLDSLVAPSGGTSQYLESPAEVVRHLHNRLHALNRTVAQDLQLHLEHPPSVEIRALHKLSPFPQPVTYSRWQTPLGSLQHNLPVSALLEAVIGPQPADTSIHLRAEVSATLVPTGERHERYACQVRLDFERNPATRDPLPAVVRAVSRLNLYQMNELAWEEVEQSQVEQATRRMERLGTLLHHEGQTQLAQTAFNEAAQIARTGRISDDGRKKLKYGTRSLIGNDHLP